MSLITGIPYPIALLVAVLVILIYTFMGGYLAVAYTDFFQSLVMLVGVMWILIAALSELGGLTAANQAILEIDTKDRKDRGLHALNCIRCIAL